MQPISSLLLLADAAPAGTAASSKVGVAIVVLVFVIVFALAVRAALRHFKGEGGCCGGGAGAPPPVADKAIGPAVARRELALGGLHCMKCVARVKAALEAIPGVAAEVTLEPQNQLSTGYGLAVVRMDRDVPEADLRKAVEDQGFRVVSIS